MKTNTAYFKKGRGKDRTKRKSKKLARNLAIGAAGVGGIGLAALAAKKLTNKKQIDPLTAKKTERSEKLKVFRESQGMTSDKQSKLKQSLKDKSTSVKRAAGGRTDYSNQEVDTFLKRKRKDLTLKTYDRKGRNVTKKERTKAIGFSKNMYEQTQLAHFAKVKASGALAKAGKAAAMNFRMKRMPKSKAGMSRNTMAVKAEMRKPRLLGLNQPAMQMNTVGGVRKTYPTRGRARAANAYNNSVKKLRKANPVTNALRRKNFR